MGFELNRFNGEVDEELVCPICSGVLEDPLQVCYTNYTMSLFLANRMPIIVSFIAERKFQSGMEFKNVYFLWTLQNGVLFFFSTSIYTSTVIVFG